MTGFDLLSPLASRIFGGLSIGLLLALAGTGLALRHVTHQRDVLQAWQDEVLGATRAAAHRPKLAAHAVPLQVFYLGKGVDDLEARFSAARAKATAAKASREARDEQDRKDANHAYRNDLVDDRRRMRAYAGTHRLRRPADRPGPALDRGDDGRLDLPAPAFGAGEPDGDRFAAELDGAELIAITRGDFEICTVNSRKIENAATWAAEKLPQAPEEAP